MSHPGWEYMLSSEAQVVAAVAAAPRWCGDLESFLRDLAAVRERPIHLLDLPVGTAAATLYGAWLPTASADYVFVAEQLRGAHRDQVVLHEVAHMLLDHRPAGTTGGVFDGVRPELAARLLARHDHHDEQERAAELFASLILAGESSTGEWSRDPRGSRAATVFG